jgi:hypothetical protein
MERQPTKVATGHHGPGREIKGAGTFTGGIRQSRQLDWYINWREHDDVMQIRSFRGSGESAWVNAPPQKCAVLVGNRSAQSTRASGHTCRTNRPDT